jgi:hypothetical protein
LILAVLLLFAILFPSLHALHAQPTGGDVFSSNGESGKTWWDVKQKDYPECAGLMDQHEAMTRELYRLDAEAKRVVEPQGKEVVRQINDLSRRRTDVQRRIFDCIRGAKGRKRVPEKPSKSDESSAPVTLNQAVDDCFRKKVPNYRGPDWSRFSPQALRPKRVGQFAQSFVVSRVAADQALQQDELMYGTWKDRELMTDYLIGWLTHCLSERNVLPTQDPRGAYTQFLRNNGRGNPQDPARQRERNEQFFYGYGSYPLPPFWDHDVAGPPSP